jgi:hypothetical protein
MARLGLDLETLETFGVGLPAGILVKRLKTGAILIHRGSDTMGAPSFSPYRSEPRPTNHWSLFAPLFSGLDRQLL